MRTEAKVPGARRWRESWWSRGRRFWGTHLGRPFTYRVLLETGRHRVASDHEALDRALAWLLAAHGASGECGFAGEFSLANGWSPPYPETSGYIVPTLLRASHYHHRREELREAARRTGNWLTDIQLPSGAFDAPSTQEPMVFDTGQIIFGLLALAGKDNTDPYLSAARRAGEWIVRQQDNDGCWLRHSYNGIPHTYYSRVSWALILLSLRTGDERFLAAGRRQLAWVTSQQDSDGWFHNCSFMPDERPVLHVVAYTIRGLWESGILLGDAALEEAAARAAIALSRFEGGRGWLESHFGPGWSRSGRSVCMTGLCQISGIWLRMARRYGREDLASTAKRCLRYARSRQIRNRKLPQVDGALPGSAPLWGEYFPWAFPNWGVKFFVDALLLDRENQEADEFHG